MELKHSISGLAIAGSMTTLMFKPSLSSAIAFAAACALFGFIHFLERQRKEDLEVLREEFEKQLKELKNKLDGIALRGITR